MEEKKTTELNFESSDLSLDLNAPIATHLKSMSREDWRHQYVEEYLKCILCGEQLNFSHSTNFSTLEVEEEAHCLACKIRARKDHYTLQ